MALHARASVANVELRAHNRRLHLSVRDDGVGGAAPEGGSGLVGLADRVEALGGTIKVHSPAGQGTRLQIDLPIDDHPPGERPPQMPVGPAAAGRPRPGEPG